MTPSQFRQALETLAFTDGSRMALQLASGQIIGGRFQTTLTNGDMVRFTEERNAEERQWLIDVTRVAAVAEPWRDAVVPASTDDPYASNMEPQFLKAQRVDVPKSEANKRPSRAAPIRANK
jgi:hypothetical protein